MKMYKLDDLTFCWYNENNQLLIEDLNEENQSFKIIKVFFEEFENFKCCGPERDSYVFEFAAPIDIDSSIDRLSKLLDLMFHIDDLSFTTRILFLSLTSEQREDLINASKRQTSSHVPSSGDAEQPNVREERVVRRKPKERTSTDSEHSII